MKLFSFFSYPATRMLLLGTLTNCLLLGGVHAQDERLSPSVESATSPATAASPEAAPPEAATPASASLFKIGLDYYAGTSNLAGKRGYTEGIWAGSSTAYPSVAYVGWENPTGYAARVAVGVGPTFNGAERIYDQPAEAWLSVPAGPVKITAGQYWVPFGIQEWQYETKPGVMLEWSAGQNALSVSANYNRHTRSGNTYLRAGRSFGENADFGVSYAFGRGLSFNSAHDQGWGLDGTLGWNGWKFVGEYIRLRDPDAGSFRSVSAKLAYENLGRLRPFINRYDWKDHSEAFGEFRSTVYGVDYTFSPTWSMEFAHAPTSDKSVTWLQMHYTWER